MVRRSVQDNAAHLATFFLFSRLQWYLKSFFICLIWVMPPKDFKWDCNKFRSVPPSIKKLFSTWIVTTSKHQAKRHFSPPESASITEQILYKYIVLVIIHSQGKEISPVPTALPEQLQVKTNRYVLSNTHFMKRKIGLSTNFVEALIHWYEPTKNTSRPTQHTFQTPSSCLTPNSTQPNLTWPDLTWQQQPNTPLAFLRAGTRPTPSISAYPKCVGA